MIITPHVGGQGAWRIDNMTGCSAQNLRRWQAGLPLVNYFDPTSGSVFPFAAAGYPLWGDDVMSTMIGIDSPATVASLGRNPSSPNAIIGLTL